MHVSGWIRHLLAVLLIVFVTVCVIPFKYHDNGVLVKTRVGAVYLREIRGYGRKAIPQRRLPPDWGTLIGYSARNFTINLFNLGYTEPLTWEDCACGPGIVVLRKSGLTGERVPVAIYPNGTIAQGETKKVVISEVVVENDGTPARREINTPKYSLTLYRLPLTSTIYVVSVDGVPPSGDMFRVETARFTLSIWPFFSKKMGECCIWVRKDFASAAEVLRYRKGTRRHCVRTAGIRL